MIPIALARSCFCIGIHARFFVLRDITGHSGRALVPEKGQWMSYVGVLSPGAALHTTRWSTFATVSPNNHTAHRNVCPPYAWGLLSRLGVRH